MEKNRNFMKSYDVEFWNITVKTTTTILFCHMNTIKIIKNNFNPILNC